MKLKSQERTVIRYPLRKEIAPVLLGVALGMAGCATTPNPKVVPDTTQKQIEEPEHLGGIPPIKPPSQESTTQTTSCDINTSKPNQIKHPTALAGKIVAPKR